MLEVVLSPQIPENLVAADAAVLRQREERKERDPASLRGRPFEKSPTLDPD